MRTIFKTEYDQDIRLIQPSWSLGGPTLCCSLVVLAAPLAVGSYLQSQIVFVFIYAMVGVGLLILTGFTGQVSLGHAAFLAIGAYTAGYLQRLACHFSIYLPLAAWCSPGHRRARRLSGAAADGIYLVIATIAFGFIVEEIAARWESVTNGNEGMRIKPPSCSD